MEQKKIRLLKRVLNTIAVFVFLFFNTFVAHV